MMRFTERWLRLKLNEYSKELADRYAIACNSDELYDITVIERLIIPHFMELHGYHLNMESIKWEKTS